MRTELCHILGFYPSRELMWILTGKIVGMARLRWKIRLTTALGCSRNGSHRLTVSKLTIPLPQARVFWLETACPASIVMRGIMRAIRVLQAQVLISVFGLLTLPVAAQSVYGGVSGRLTTVSGTPVSAALILVTAPETSVIAQAMTDNDGHFAINNLAPDLYQIDIQANGFKHVRGSAPVHADSTTSINSVLPAGDPNVLAPATEFRIVDLSRTDVSTL